MNRMNPMNSEDAYVNLPVIETQRGFFNLHDPQFDILEIAGGLSKKCRFNGQCSRFYSVAEHSVLVAALMYDLKIGNAFEGLMHDANEAYLPDVPSPYKSVLPDLKRLEDTFDRKIRDYFKMPAVKTAECAHADCVALMIEAYFLMPSKGEGSYWAPLAPYRAVAMQCIELVPRLANIGEDSASAETMFLDNFYTLSERKI